MFKMLAVTAALMTAATTAQAHTINTANLHTREGAERFDNQVKAVAQRLCAQQRGLDMLRCRAAVREEAMEKLPEQMRLAYLQTREADIVNAANAGLLDIG